MTHATHDRLAAGARLVVTGGTATPQEALAVLLALDEAAGADASATAAGSVQRAGWREATRREQTRGVVYAAAPDLTRARWP